MRSFFKDRKAASSSSRSLAEREGHISEGNSSIAIAQRTLRVPLSERNKTLRDDRIREATKLLNSVTRELAKLIATIDPLLPGTRSLKENISLHEFLAQFVSARTSFARSKGVHLVLNLPPSIPNISVRFSRTRLLQVVENLFQNSVYWLAHAPIVTSQEKQIVIEATPSGFIWSDTGPGISPTLESSIFEAFVSDKPPSEGQGLGLRIVSTFLEAERCSIHLGTNRNELPRSTTSVHLTKLEQIDREGWCRS